MENVYPGPEQITQIKSHDSGTWFEPLKGLKKQFSPFESKKYLPVCALTNWTIVVSDSKPLKANKATGEWRDKKRNLGGAPVGLSCEAVNLNWRS